MEIKGYLAVPYNTDNYNHFVKEFFNTLDRYPYKEQKPSASFAHVIDYYVVHGTYTDPDGNEIIVLSVKVRNNSNARQAQRNFVSHLLSNEFNQYSAAMVAYFDSERENWKLSFVTVEMEMSSKGVELKFKPAKRFSFLVGKDEPTKTYVQQLNPIYLSNNNPSLDSIMDAFSVNRLSKDFYKDYRDKYIDLKDILEHSKDFRTLANNLGEKVNNYASTFAKKTLSQIVFLFFIQKKGWLGVEFGKKWGEGNKTYIQDATKGFKGNFFDDFLEPLFYEALNKKRPDDFYCGVKIPFLNGGLFQALDNYKWTDTTFSIPNEFWFNDKEDGFIDILSQYNFTVDESDPSEQDIAIDPEMLGKIFESLLDIDTRKDKGAFYTPREIVKHMCVEALVNKISSEIGLDYTAIENYVKYGDALEEKEFIEAFAKDIDEYLANLTIVDPAVGSGAFLVGMMNEIVNIRQDLSQYFDAPNNSKYDLKVNCIQNTLYGVDIEFDAIEIAKLRLWLSLIVDENAGFTAPNPLPNLNFHLRVGNSLLEKYEKVVLWDEKWYTAKRKAVSHFEVSLFDDTFVDDLYESIKIDKKIFFRLTDEKEKADKLRIIEEKQLSLLTAIMERENKKESSKKLEKLLKQKTKPFFIWRFEFSEVFEKGGFDIVIGNPPYISTKGVEDSDKIALKDEYGFADDTYSHFYFLGLKILKEKGNLSYITSKSYWTIQTKLNLRELLLNNRIHYLFDTANPFEAAMVDTCIAFITKEKPLETNVIRFYDGRNSLTNPEEYSVEQKVFIEANNKVIFKPTEQNMRIYKSLNLPAKALYEQWWEKISTSKNISKNKKELEEYRQNLKPGDIALLGCLTEGGQGLATGNNGKYIAVRRKTRWADRIFETRPKKLIEAVKNYKIQLPEKAKEYSSVLEYYNSLKEDEVVQLFDDLKEQYGRDIFGQGYLYRVIEENEIANPDLLTQDEKDNGIDKSKPYYVLYDKGDKDGNRWFLETPFAIAWNKENVQFLKANSGKKGNGMPVVRNPQFNFKEGLCWSDINTKYLKCRIKEKSINDVKSMSIYPITNMVPGYYIICLINSFLYSHYVDNFVNNTQTFQINDARQLPIIIPTTEQLASFEELFDSAVTIKKNQFKTMATSNDNDNLLMIQEQLDRLVEALYSV